MEREEYLQFFMNNRKKPPTKAIFKQQNTLKQSRSMHLHGQNFDKKILPHISEEYQYKITNQLLVQKIMNPKRDKLIVQNFQKSISRPATRQTKSRGQTTNSLDNKGKSLDRGIHKTEQPKTGSLSLYSRLKMSKSMSRLRQKGVNSYQRQRQFNVALENDRMGQRIIKTKSSVQQILRKTFFTYKNDSKSNHFEKENNRPDLKSSFIRGRQNKKYFFSGKINNGVKVFFNNLKDNEQSNRSRSQADITTQQLKTIQQKNQDERNYNLQSNQNEKSQDYKNREVRKIKTGINFRNRFIKQTSQQTEQQSGYAQTNFPGSSKTFGMGPTILMIYDLEIVSNPSLKQNSMLILELITHQKRIGFKKSKQRSIRTMPISYDFLRPAHNQDLAKCVKFAINVSQIGDFVPLRLYRVYGVEMQQLGIIDIDLSLFKYRKSQLIDPQNQHFHKQYRINDKGQTMQKDIVSANSSGNLRKNLLNKPVQIYVKLYYKVYSKRFKILQNNQN